MAQISGNINGLSWLHPQETPLEALAKGAQVGNLLTQAMAHRQALSIEAQRAPLMLDAIETRNKVEQSRLAEQWLQNREIEYEQEAWRQDASRPEFQALMAEPDPNRVVSMGLPPVRSFRAQKLAQARSHAASESVVVQARKQQYTELNKLAAEVMNGGETPTQVVDQWGVQTWNPQELTQLKNKVIAREQEQKLAIEKARGEKTIRSAEIRAHSNEEIARIKTEKASAASDADKIVNQAIKATYLRRLDVIENDPMLDADEKVRQIRNLAREFNLPNVQFPDKTTPAGSPAPAPGKPSGVALPSPKTAAEYNALPPGTRYVHPTLGIRIKAQ